MWNMDVKRESKTQLQVAVEVLGSEVGIGNAGFGSGGVKESRPGCGWNEGERTEKRSMECTTL